MTDIITSPPELVPYILGEKDIDALKGAELDFVTSIKRLYKNIVQDGDKILASPSVKNGFVTTLIFRDGKISATLGKSAI